MPDPELRLVDCIWPLDRSDDERLDLWPNMRVPQRSVLAKPHGNELTVRQTTRENQDWWETGSDGRFDSLPLKVEAQWFGPNLVALLS